jgi:hypothetical protein
VDRYIAFEEILTFIQNDLILPTSLSVSLGSGIHTRLASVQLESFINSTKVYR